KRLPVAAPAGTETLRISNRIGLTVTSTLLIDAESPDRQEFIALTALAGGTTAAQAATVTLAHPMAFGHPAGALVQRLTLLPLGAPKSLLPDPLAGEPAALAGDTTLF